MSEWISVKERLPEHGLDVLIKLHYKGYYIVQAVYLDNYATIGRDYRNGVFITMLPPRVRLTEGDIRQFYFEKNRVTHWMEMPKPPERLS